MVFSSASTQTKSGVCFAGGVMGKEELTGLMGCAKRGEGEKSPP